MENKKNQDNQKKYFIIGIIVLVVLVAISIILGVFLSKNEKKDDIPYTELINQIDDGNVEKIEMTTGSQTIKVKYKGEEEERNAIIPNTQVFMELVQQKVQEGTDIELIQNPVNPIRQVFSAVFAYLPTILIIILFVLLLKMQGLGEKGKVYTGEENRTNVTFDDVAGLDEEKNEMIEIVDFLKEPKKFQEMGAKG